MAEPAYKAAAAMFDRDQQPSSSAVLHALVKRLHAGNVFLGVDIKEPLPLEDKTANRKGGPKHGVRCCAYVQLPMFKKLTASSASSGLDFEQLRVKQYEMSDSRNFRSKQLPDAAWLKVGRSQWGRCSESVDDLQGVASRDMHQHLLALLRWQLPWQLTPAQSAALRGLLGEYLWAIWVALTATAPAELQHLSGALTVEMGNLHAG